MPTQYHYAATMLWAMVAVMASLHLCQAVGNKFEKYRALSEVRQRCVALWVVRSAVCELTVMLTFGWGVVEQAREGFFSLGGMEVMWTGFHFTMVMYCCELFFRPTEKGMLSSLLHHIATLVWGNYLAWAPSAAFARHTVYLYFMGIGVSPWPCNVAFFTYYFCTPTPTTVKVMKAAHAVLLCLRIIQWAGWAAIIVPLFPELSPLDQGIVSVTAVVFFCVEFQLPYTLSGMIKSYERKMHSIAKEELAERRCIQPELASRGMTDRLG